MSRFLGLSSLAIIAIACGLYVLLSGCSTPSILTPPVGPNTLHPCGLTATQCVSHMCCDGLDMVCGGLANGHPECSEGSCCYEPETEPSFSVGVPIRAPTLQTPEVCQ